MIFVPDGKTVGLASIAKQTDKQGDIAKQTLADKVEEKKHKGEKKKKKEEPKTENVPAAGSEKPAEETKEEPAEEAKVEEASKPAATEDPKV
jgi:hypothetical protein